MAEEVNDMSVETYEIAASVITYNGQNLGVTESPIGVKRENTYYTAKCDIMGETVVLKRVTGVKFTITGDFKEVSLLESLVNGGVATTAILGTDIYSKVGPLVVHEAGSSRVHIFPKAVMIPEYSRKFGGTTISVTFEVVAAASNIYYESSSL